MTAIFTIRNISNDRACDEIWDRLVELCPDAWFFHTRLMIDARKIFMTEAGLSFTDLSFFIEQDGEVIGLMPLVISPVKVSGVVYQEASFSGIALPWPIFTLEGEELEKAEDFAFAEAERRAISSNAARISYTLVPPAEWEKQASRFTKILSGRRYLDASYLSHNMIMDDHVLMNVRERYRRYVKKFIELYDVYIIAGDDITDELIEVYRGLHEKDAGAVVRTPRTYTEQARMARNHLGFWTVARRKDSGVIAGILQIVQHKNSCYDGSVAVDPDYQDEQVSHLLKWHTIEKMIKEKVYAYELGQRAELSNRNRIFSSKNFGISFFKEGWSRGKTKPIYVVEKFLDFVYMKAVYADNATAAGQYLGLIDNQIVDGKKS